MKKIAFGISSLVACIVVIFLVSEQDNAKVTTKQMIADEPFEGVEREIAVQTIPVSTDGKEAVIPLSEDDDVKVRVNSPHVRLIYNKSSEVMHIRSIDKHYYYRLVNSKKMAGSLRVTLRELENGDTFIFTKFMNESNEDYTATVSLPVREADSHSLAKYSELGEVERIHHSVFGINETSHPIGILSAFNGQKLMKEIMLGKNYTSFPLVKEYENGSTSTVRELIKENAAVTVAKTDSFVTVRLEMALPKEAISDSWLLVSDKKLFKKEKNRNAWFKRTIEEYISINNWLTAEGAYTKAPWSIEPSTKMGYVRAINRLQGKIYLFAYQENKERYLYDLVLNSVADLDVYSKGKVSGNEELYFYTEFTSTWLKEKYGITAPYVDTRLNENAAKFLEYAGVALDIEILQDDTLAYADFLVSQRKLGNVIPVEPEGYVIADYYKPESPKTHASLNHILGGMRFLLGAYEETGNEKYLQTALKVKAGIENLYPGWIRPNGDLWYQVSPDLSFGGTDYEQLTLFDLLATQETLERIGLERSAIFDEMIRSKTGFLISEGKQLIRKVKEQLVEQGFAELVPISEPAA